MKLISRDPLPIYWYYLLCSICFILSTRSVFLDYRLYRQLIQKTYTHISYGFGKINRLNIAINVTINRHELCFWMMLLVWNYDNHVMLLRGFYILLFVKFFPLKLCSHSKKHRCYGPDSKTKHWTLNHFWIIQCVDKSKSARIKCFLYICAFKRM